MQSKRGAPEVAHKLRMGRHFHNNDDAGFSQTHGMRASSAARASLTATCTSRLVERYFGISGLPLPPPMGRRNDLEDMLLKRTKHEKVPHGGPRNTRS